MNKKDFAEFIKEKRRELNLTQEELADKLNVSRGVVAKWESGLRYPDMETSQLLASALGVTPNELYEKSRINDSKYKLKALYIITPIVLVVAIIGLVVISMSGKLISVVDQHESSAKDNMLALEIVDGKIVATGDSYFRDASAIKLEYSIDGGSHLN